MGYPEPVMFRRQYAHVRIIAGTRYSSGIMKDLGAAPDTLHTGLSAASRERESRRDAETRCDSRYYAGYWKPSIFGSAVLSPGRCPDRDLGWRWLCRPAMSTGSASSFWTRHRIRSSARLTATASQRLNHSNLEFERRPVVVRIPRLTAVSCALSRLIPANKIRGRCRRALWLRQVTHESSTFGCNCLGNPQR
jgi:hypothetical protein